jgi:hypothetical protein
MATFLSDAEFTHLASDEQIAKTVQALELVWQRTSNTRRVFNRCARNYMRLIA